MFSPYVQREWEHALALERPNFVRPTYWEEPLPMQREQGLPPPALERLHFERIPMRASAATVPAPEAVPVPVAPAAPASAQAPAPSASRERAGTGGPMINYAAREITLKLVYYGPAAAGKSANLRYLQLHARGEARGPLLTLGEDDHRTLFFDIADGQRVRGFRIRYQVYTVPGHGAAAARAQLLKGVNGVVFVADSSTNRLADNEASFQELCETLVRLGAPARPLPLVMQFNKRDVTDAMPVEQLRRALEPRRFVDAAVGAPAAEAPGAGVLRVSGCHEFEAVALSGRGVLETFAALSGLVLETIA
jgi:signal recognition particle receptor subunit beta